MRHARKTRALAPAGISVGCAPSAVPSIPSTEICNPAAADPSASLKVAPCPCFTSKVSFTPKYSIFRIVKPCDHTRILSNNTHELQATSWRIACVLGSIEYSSTPWIKRNLSNKIALQ